MSSGSNLLREDAGRELLVKLCRVMTLKLDAALAPAFVQELGEDGEYKTLPNPEHASLGAAEMAAIIKLLSDNSVTLASIRRGDFGETVKRAEEDYPFPVGGTAQ